LLDVPELFGKVDIVAVGVLESLDLVPEGFYLCKTVVADLGDVGSVVDLFTVLVDGNEKLLYGVIGELLCLPGFDGIEYLEGLCGVDDLVVHAEEVCACLAGFVVVDTVDLFEVGVGDLLGVF